MLAYLQTFFLFAFVIFKSESAFSEEYFGKFYDVLKGEFIDAKPRPKFKLESEFRFEDPNGLLWSVPKAKEVDGASIPQAFWSIIGGPFEGEYIKASVIHDHYCDEKIRTDHDTHRNFYYGMRTAGVPEWKAKFMYWVVDTFGPGWTLTKRIVQDLKCETINEKLTCSQIPKITFEVVSLQKIDLSEPEVLAAALSKASTIARTLKTTDGKVLDISSTGNVYANIEEISRSAKTYRTVFDGKDYKENPKLLGVLSQWNADNLEKVMPWENNKLPEFNSSIVLKPRGRSQLL